jgi:hypothetical protein
VAAGFVPPLAEGFSDYLLRARRPAMDSEPALARLNPNDSHPPTPARLAALAALDPGPPPDSEEDPAASSLLSNLPLLEWAALATRLAPTVTLTPVTWDRAGAEVFLPAWRRTVDAHRTALAGAWLGNLADWVHAATALGRRVAARGRKPLTDAAARATGLVLLSRALGTALVAQGWTLTALPAEPFTCRRGDATVAPYTLVEQMAGGSLDAASWARMREELGIADGPLAS